MSTWRNRFKDGPNAFPAPVGGTPARPLFDFEDVADWVSRNRPEKNLKVRLLPIQVWAVIRSLTMTGVEQFELVYWLHLLLAARKRTLMKPADGPALPEPDLALGDLPGEQLSVAISSLVAGADSQQLIAISDVALARLSAGYGRSGGDIGAVGSTISRILARASLAQVVSTSGDAVVYDPSCGIGETLIRTAGWYLRSERRVRLLGTEINSKVATIAAIRLLLRDITAEVANADSLATQQFAGQQADLVVSEPPLGVKWAGMWPDDARAQFGVPPLRNADLAWVVDAVARLRVGGLGLVLTSIAALSRGGSEEKVRAALVRSGAVKAVIALPPNLLQYSGVGLALWVLRAPRDGLHLADQSVQVIDASDPALRESGTAKRAEWIEEHIANWVLSPADIDPVLGVTTAVVHFDQLLDAGMDLTPTRWVAEVAGIDVRYRLFELNDLFDAAIQEFRPEPLDFDNLPSAAHFVTVREMTETPESREAKLWTGRGVSNEDPEHDTITSREVSSGVILPVRETSDGPGFRTQPGDIVFTTMTRVRAVVDVVGGHRLGNGVHALRLHEGSRFAPEYVARCLSARWNERHQKGSSIKHAKPGDLEVPLIPIEAQRAWMGALADLEKIRSQAQDLLDSVEELETAAFNALRYGREENQ